ncbi:response regulator [Spirosoma sp. HMF4905]|uniref:Response regulator n=1 Tax=Spirosoma arboris TaxID=2682092 RepID=A0A7K1S537_9BACT|nr:response regulator transcription factor [Spirosoma arboris]MVM28941.1 response regulator [Spirosoma arboris]
MPVRIVVADDHPVVLDGIRLMLDGIDGYVLVGVATSLKEIISVCTTALPDVLILDLNIDGKNSLDLIPDLLLRHPDLKIIVFSAYQSTVLLKKGLEVGIKGYLLKDASKPEWIDALTTVGKGNIYLSKYVKTSVIPLDEFADVVDFAQIAALSEQEKKIIHLTAQGLTEQELAETLFISKHTVHTHKKNIFRKLHLHTNADLMKFAYENNLV